MGVHVRVRVVDHVGVLEWAFMCVRVGVHVFARVGVRECALRLVFM